MPEISSALGPFSILILQYAISFNVFEQVFLHFPKLNRLLNTKHWTETSFCFQDLIVFPNCSFTFIFLMMKQIPGMGTKFQHHPMKPAA